MSWLKNVKFDDKGLITAVVQDEENGEVLMVAYMNKEALEKTLQTGKVYFYSRSRRQLWLKGETSGFTQSVKSIYADCDLDCVLIKVQQTGGACHMGYRSCFYRRVTKDKIEIVGEKVFEPGKVYKKDVFSK